MKKNILITGGAGFIGSHLARLLAKEGHSVHVLDLRDPEKPITGVQYTKGDVRNAPLLHSLMKECHAVYHFAATVSIPLCQKDPLESTSNNFTATLIVLEEARKILEATKKKIRVIFASTAALYGDKGNDGRALKEEDAATHFLSYYAAQKMASEQMIYLYNRTHSIPCVIFRFFNVFGPGQDPTSPYSGVITVFNRFIQERKPLPLNGGGTQTRDFISVHDLVRGCADALDLSDDACDAMAMNLGTGHSITIELLAQKMKEVAQSKVEDRKSVV